MSVVETSRRADSVLKVLLSTGRKRATNGNAARNITFAQATQDLGQVEAIDFRTIQAAYKTP